MTRQTETPPAKAEPLALGGRLGQLQRLHALMADDIELLILGGSLKIGIDGFEIRVAGPGRARWQPLASVSKPTLAQGVGCVYKVQFVLSLRTLDQLAKPRPLRPGIPGKIEHDGDPFRQKSANVWGERVLQPGRELHVSRNVGDLTGEQGFQAIVLHKKDSLFPISQISCESGLAGRHLPAEENQLS